MERHCPAVCYQGAANWPTVVQPKKSQMLDYPDPDFSLANACAEKARYRGMLLPCIYSEYGYTYLAAIAQSRAQWHRPYASLRLLYPDIVQASLISSSNLSTSVCGQLAIFSI